MGCQLWRFDWSPRHAEICDDNTSKCQSGYWVGDYDILKRRSFNALFRRWETSQLSRICRSIAIVNVLWVCLFCILFCWHNYTRFPCCIYVIYKGALYSYSRGLRVACSTDSGNAKTSQRGTATIMLHASFILLFPQTLNFRKVFRSFIRRAMYVCVEDSQNTINAKRKYKNISYMMEAKGW